MAAPKKAKAATGGTNKRPASFKARSKARASKEAARRSKAASKGWETRRAREAEEAQKAAARREAARLGWERRKAREAEEAAKRAAASRLGWERRKAREAEAARKLEARRAAARLGIERRKAREAEEAKKKAEADAKKAAAAAKKAADKERKRQQRQQEKIRKETCADLLQDPPVVSEFVWGSNCFDKSSVYAFADGSIEGEIIERARDDWRGTWQRLLRWLGPWAAANPGVWMRVGVYGRVEGGTSLDLDAATFDFDGYDKRGKAELGKAFSPGLIGRHCAWRMVGKRPRSRNKWLTLANLVLVGEDMARNFEGRGFGKLVLSIAVVTSKDKPSDDE